MTRVLVVEPAGNLWGSERALLDLLDHAPGLQAAVCLPPGRPLGPELRRRKVRALPWYVYELHKKTRLHRLMAAAGVLLACLRFRPDVVYLNQTGAYKVALPAARLLRLPMVAHLRMFEDVGYLARQRPRPEVLRAVIAVSASIEQEVGRFTSLSAVRCLQIFDAYARRADRPEPADGSRIPDRIACLGRITEGKGQDLLIDALALVTGREAPIECLIAGDGEAAFVERLAGRAARLQCAAVRWLGVLKDVGPTLDTCAALVAPSRQEALGRVVLEAWDAGAVPLVLAGSGGPAEIVAAADAGVICPEQTPPALAEALERTLALGEAERRRLVANGRAWMAAHCDAPRYGRRIVEILSEAGRR